MSIFTSQRQKTIISILIFMFGVLVQVLLQQWSRPYAFENIYFFPLYPSSETMMQTVSIEDLRDSPLESLWNIHIQPPGFDVIRAILARFWVLINPKSFDGDAHLMDLLHQVDRSLYFLFALLYGILGCIIFLWLTEITALKYAVISSILFLLHPASIFYATLLDSTFISSFLITLTFYLLYKQQRDPKQPIAYLTLATLALFFTRSIFQWPIILVLAFFLVAIHTPARKIILFTIICSAVIFAYLGKQYAQFGIFSTTSFTGYNLTKSVDMKISQTYWSKLPDNTDPKYNVPNLPEVLIRDRKLTGVRNFNHLFYLDLNQKLTAKFIDYIKTANPRKLLANYLDNAWIYFLPSSRYGKHVIVDHLSWRGIYDVLFSYPILPGLLLLSGVYWLIKTNPKDYIQGMAYLLPVMYVFLTSVLLEKGENSRFKFFLEPTLFIFMATQFYSIWGKLQETIIKKEAASND